MSSNTRRCSSSTSTGLPCTSPTVLWPCLWHSSHMLEVHLRSRVRRGRRGRQRWWGSLHELLGRTCVQLSLRGNHFALQSSPREEIRKARGPLALGVAPASALGGPAPLEDLAPHESGVCLALKNFPGVVGMGERGTGTEKYSTARVTFLLPNPRDARCPWIVVLNTPF